ncbi:ROK family protein [Streptomyces sp. NPDC088258]|uniref:ROK family protein n=1 Tax=Streptomyces sp. NPDC088258 TaxID=3365849 RepID=UPI00381BB771
MRAPHRNAPASVPPADVADAASVTGFDIGGTWLRFRSGGRAVRRPAPSLLNHPGLSVDALTDRLLDELTGPEVGPGRVVVSLGAAMDDLTSRVHGSGPLWGAGRPRPGLVAELARRRPDIRWHVYNDVTCAVTDLAAGRGAPLTGASRVAYVTVSSGIALKTADLAARTITVGADGFQGEIGHLPASVPAGPDPAALARLLDLPCECGGRGHVAALSAGPALPRVARALGLGPFDGARLADRVADGDREAVLLLDVVTHPVAQAIRWLTAIDPAIALVGIGGGVAEGLGGVYQRALELHLDREADYTSGAARRASPTVLAPGEIDPIRGAALLAEGFLTVVKP